MVRRSLAHPDQLPLQFDSAADLERLIEARVAERCAAQTLRWRLRLVVIETVLFSALVAISGLTLGQPGWLVLRATVLIAISCFLSGMLLVWLSIVSARLLDRLSARWRS
ncbi:hypothetical protein AB2M62_03400 [Sphingomonas sp. MMS12-HWE2-04]|uniref:hypothetical protein n=1 Tax=Sphingomonas sp. MMS12-HWE2-04 TaxID=3234199 RepID=UPI003850925F